jgi:Rrf2 family protein
MSKLVTISEASHIALHGMILIVQADGILNVNKISERTDSSKHHVAKIFQRLVKAKFVTSQRGPNGGFVLNKKPEEISFLDLYELIEGPVSLNECPLDKPTCPFDECIMKGITKKLTIEFRDYMASQTLDMYI